MSENASDNDRALLDGVRVIDLSWGLAGSLATQILAEAGADVVKIDPPGGDPLAGLPALATWNRSKRKETLDLRRGPDRASLLRRLETTDVVVHTFAPPRAASFGLDQTELAARFPQLIVATVSGYPAGSRGAGRPGYDILVQARSGAMDELVGFRDGPIFYPLELSAWSAMYQTAAGILSRLLVRQRSGRGGVVRTSLYQGQLAILSMFWNRHERPSPLMAAKSPLPKRGAAAARMLYECRHGDWIQVVSMGLADVPAVIEAVASAGERNPDSDAVNTPEAEAVYRRVFLTRTAGEWLELLWTSDVPAYPVSHVGEILDDEQAVVNGYTVVVDDPDWGRVRQAMAPLTTEPPLRVRDVSGDPVVRPAPSRGQGPVFSRSEPSPQAAPAHPLAGIKVLDFGMFWAGPYAPQMLGDLGAEVIKVEPTTGDRMRGRGELMFVGCQRNKRSIALDLSSPLAREPLRRLIEWADVVHHNLRVPKARALGVDEPSIHAVNPNVVYSHVSSYGPRGRRADWPGYDPIAQAASGWLADGSGEGNPPMYHRTGYADTLCAQASTVATLLGLWKRSQVGSGTTVHVSLFGAAAFTNSLTMRTPGRPEGGPRVRLVDGEQTGFSPYYRIYRTRTDWIAVAATRPGQQEALLRVVGVSSPDDLVDAIAGRPGEALCRALDEAGVPAELVRTDQEGALFSSELERASGITIEFRHPLYGRQELVGAAWDFDDLSLRFDRPPPLCGQHSREILSELGFDDRQCAGLEAAGVVSSPSPAE